MTAYLLWIKLGIAVVALSVAFFSGCRVQANQDADKREAQAARIADLNRALSDFVGVFDDVNAQAARDKATAAKQAERAADAVKAADKRADRYRTDIQAIEDDIAKAKRDPDCKRALEQQTCAILR